MQAERWNQNDVRFPQALNTIAQAPTSIFTLGNRTVLDAPCVAIVGTRHPTPYGERVAHQLATSLANAGACIVSGMAFGIDGCAHSAALKSKGRTAAVLGAGIDYPYPPSHRRLYQDIAANGVVISEFGPGIKPFKGCFPRRNRIIAGLSAVTIVVEASVKSGALITAKYALDEGRTVAAVPGPIESPNSHGPNHLIRDGAQVIASLDDALALLGFPPEAIAKTKKNAKVRDLTPDEATVWDVLATPDLTTDAVIQRSKLPANRCLAAITQLEIRGILVTLLSGEIRRV